MESVDRVQYIVKIELTNLINLNQVKKVTSNSKE